MLILKEGMNSKLNLYLTKDGSEQIKDLVRDSLDAGKPHVQWGAE